MLKLVTSSFPSKMTTAINDSEVCAKSLGGIVDVAYAWGSAADRRTVYGTTVRRADLHSRPDRKTRPWPPPRIRWHAVDRVGPRVAYAHAYGKPDHSFYTRAHDCALLSIGKKIEARLKGGGGGGAWPLCPPPPPPLDPLASRSGSNACARSL